MMLVEKARAIPRVVSVIVVIVLFVGAAGAYYFISVNNPEQTSGTTSHFSTSTSTSYFSTSTSRTISTTPSTTSTTSSTTSTTSSTTSTTSSTTSTTSSTTPTTTSTTRSGSATTKTTTQSVTTSTTTSITSTVGPFNGAWSNLRGVAYPWQVLIQAPDQGGSPDPEWSFPQFRSLGFNLIRMDGISWGLYEKNPSTFTENMKRVVTAANANGIYVIWSWGLSPTFMPSDYTGGLTYQTGFWQWFWNDGPYPSTNPALNGLPVWQVFFNTFVIPMMKIVDSQPCTLGYKFLNEPSGFPTSNSNSYIASFLGYAGNRIRAYGSTRYIDYTGPGSHPGYIGLITDIQNAMTGGYKFRPALYDVHYPLTMPATWANDASQMSKYNVAMWDGEDSASFFLSSTDLSLLVQYNAASSLYRWDEDGGLLAKNSNGACDVTNCPVDPTPTILSTAHTISNLETQVLGPAQFFR